ncbi:MFS transporter [Bacillus subtilis]|uniref:MDR family MFS transporter n=1 Tax=Bacillus subtilis TaxID=1423 RepID=UPI002E2006C3|nr:MFS transporter [Bacillus subtilis]MED3488819.1 MFS transporter [Bacillus subtilis]
MLTSFHSIKSRYTAPVRLRFFGELLTSLTGAMMGPFMVLYLHEQLNGSIMMPMLIISLQPFADIFLTLAAGKAADRLGRRTAILTALLLQSAAMTGFVFAEHAYVFAILYVMNGIGRSLYIPASRAQIAESTPESRRSEVFAVINAIYSAGLTAGPLVGMLLYNHNPVWIFALDAAALFIYFLIAALKLPETKPLHPAVTPKMSASFMIYRPVLLLLLLSLPISMLYAQTETTYRLFSKNMFSDYLSILTIYSAAKALFSCVLQVPLVKGTEKLSMKTILFITYICYSLAAAGFACSTSLTMLLVTAAVMTVGESIGLTHIQTFISKLAPPHLLGRFYAVYGLHWDISRSIGPLAGGLILTSFGGEVIFYALAVCLLTAGLSLTYTIEKLEHKVIRKVNRL